MIRRILAGANGHLPVRAIKLQRDRAGLAGLIPAIDLDLVVGHPVPFPADAVAQVGASSPKEMGKVMPVALKAAGDRASGKRVSDAVRQALAGGA